MNLDHNYSPVTKEGIPLVRPIVKDPTQLAGKNIVVYDLEIRKNPTECTNGWASKNEFGISVACAFDYRDMRYRVFLFDNLTKLTDRLNEPGTTIVGFNHVSFDNEVLRASNLPLRSDSELLNYDMLTVSRAGAGVDKFAKGFKLDEHLRQLRLPMKTGDGALAPDLWKMKKIGELVDYCLADVTAEKALFEYIMKNGTLACAHSSGKNYIVKRAEV